MTTLTTPTHTLSRLTLGLALLALLAAPLRAQAEEADRDQPVHIKASTSFGDDRTKAQVYQGNVVLTQGSRQVLTDKLVITQDPDGYYKGVATGGTGGLVHFREKQEGKNEIIEGEAERIEFDTRTEKIKLFERAHIKKADGEVRGRYIERDGYSETFKVTNGANGQAVVGGEQIETVLQPKPRNKDATKEPAKPKDSSK